MVSSRLAGIPLPIVSEDAEWLEQLTLRASRRRADDRRTGGRLHLGMVVGFKSERWPTSNRNPDWLRVGIGGRIKSESAKILRLLKFETWAEAARALMKNATELVAAVQHVFGVKPDTPGAQRRRHDGHER